MANKRMGQTARASEWAKHLRPYGKAVFWGRQRADDRAIVRNELTERDEALDDHIAMLVNKDDSGLFVATEPATVFTVKPKRAPRRKLFKIRCRCRSAMFGGGKWSRWMTKASYSSATKRDYAFEQMVAHPSDYFEQEFRKVDP